MKPYQWSLANQSSLKVENDGPKVPKQAEAKRDGVINPQNYIFNQFLYGTIRCSQNATNQPKSTVKLGYMCRLGLTVQPAVTLIKQLKKKRDFF